MKSRAGDSSVSCQSLVKDWRFIHNAHVQATGKKPAGLSAPWNGDALQFPTGSTESGASSDNSQLQPHDGSNVKDWCKQKLYDRTLCEIKRLEILLYFNWCLFFDFAGQALLALLSLTECHWLNVIQILQKKVYCLQSVMCAFIVCHDNNDPVSCQTQLICNKAARFQLSSAHFLMLLYQ